MALVASSEGSILGLQETVDFPCEPWFLIGLYGDGHGDHDFYALPQVGSDGVCVLLEICGVVVRGCLSEHDPVGGGKIVLECL